MCIKGEKKKIQKKSLTFSRRNRWQEIGARCGAVDAVSLARCVRRDRGLVGGSKGAHQLLLERWQMIDLQLQLNLKKEITL